jgi:hypothetical protein
MFKLLTEEERYKVRREYSMRRAIVMLLALILVLVMGVIGLLPPYVLSNSRHNEVLERARIANSSKQHEGNLDLEVWLVEINNELEILSPKLDTDRPSSFIGKVLDEKITGVRLTGFSWIKVKNGVTLSISGVARDRQALIAFENNINSSGQFSNVALPISNLAKDRDIDFQIKFSPSP